MGEEKTGRENSDSGERIIVAVKDVGEDSLGQASLIDDRERAARIVESLVEHGVEPEAVRALGARELPFKVSYRWVVELAEKGDPATGRGTVSQLLGSGLRLVRAIAPERPFELRLDRMVWVGLWLASLLVLGISVIASMSNGSAREVVIEAPAQYQGEFQPQAPIPSPPVASPLNREAAPEGTSPVVGGASQLPQCAAGGLDNCRCADFKTQPEAQQFYEAHPPGPGHIVDPDGDGVMCEWLPKS
jgi:hypothetical protein